MARAPVAGATKTRLAPLLGHTGCARLQRALIRRTVALGTGPTYFAYTPPGSAALLGPLIRSDTVMFGQRGADLGARMAAAVTDVVAARPAPVLLVGTDCPVLDIGHLRAASTALAGGSDVVLGPTFDGGYYLIGLARPTPAVFDLRGLWGGPLVAARTRSAVLAAGLTLAEIAVEHDLDTPDDAAVHLRDPRLPTEIAELLRCRPPGAGVDGSGAEV